MAVDLQIEVFSVDLIDLALNDMGLTKSVLPRCDNYDIKNPITCLDDFFSAVNSRRKVFHSILFELCTNYYQLYSRNNLDFYILLEYFMEHILPYYFNLHLQIFDKVFMACIMLIQMVFVCVKNDNEMYQNCSSLCLAMYFDIECKEEFYDKGGWKGLENLAKSYNKSFLDTWNFDARITFNSEIRFNYSSDLIKNAMKEKIINGKSACLKCNSLFYALGTNYDLSNYVTNIFLLTEGYFQLTLRLLTKEELNENINNLFQNAGIEDCVEKMYGFDSVDDEKQKYVKEQAMKYFPDYLILNTNMFLFRLFSSLEDLNADDCMFCGANLNELSTDVTPVSDPCKEKIKSVINDTLMNIDIKSKDFTNVSVEPVQEQNLEKNIKEVLQLFSGLGTQPGTSRILSNLRKSSGNELNEENLAKHNQKASEGKGKEKRRRKKRD